MPVRKIFIDSNQQQLEAYVNDDAKLFISVGSGDPEDQTGGYITLDRSDLDELIDLLMDLKDQVLNESDLED